MKNVSSMRAGASVLALLASVGTLAAQPAAPAGRDGASQPGKPTPSGLKHIALGSGGRAWIAFGIQNRTRIEIWRGFGFGTAAQSDDEYALNRVLLNADLHLGSVARLFVEGKSAVLTARSLPGGRRPVDGDDIDVQNGYVELTAKSKTAGASVRVGRQELLFGRQRLVSPLDWVNTRRTFDGLRGTIVLRNWTVDGFLTHPVRVLKSDFNRWDGSVDFFGLYAQKKAGRLLVTDLYWLGLTRATAAFNGTTGGEHRQTLGVRLSGKGAGGKVEYDVEAAYQFGTVGSGNISAGMFGSDFAYLLTARPGAPRLHAGFDYATGDAAPGGNVGTFNQLFPLGHAFLGFIDVVGRQNVVAPNAGLAVRLLPALTLDVTAFRFTRAKGADALYNAGGGIERAAGASVAKGVGTELDLTGTYRAGSRVVVLAGYSRLWAGVFIRQTGAAGNTSFAYCSLQITY